MITVDETIDANIMYRRSLFAYKSKTYEENNRITKISNYKPFSSKHDGIQDPKVKSTRSACLIMTNFLKVTSPIIAFLKTCININKYCKKNNNWLVGY